MVAKEFSPEVIRLRAFCCALLIGPTKTVRADSFRGDGIDVSFLTNRTPSQWKPGMYVLGQRATKSLMDCAVLQTILSRSLAGVERYRGAPSPSAGRLDLGTAGNRLLIDEASEPRYGDLEEE